MLKRFSLVFLVVAAVGCKSNGHPAAAAQGSASGVTEQNRVAASRAAKLNLHPIRAGMIPRLNTAGMQPGELDDADDTDPKRAARRAERIAKLDTDGDGQISPKEREAFRRDRDAEIQAKLDTNKDGAVSPEEREAAQKQRAETLRTKLDTDGDGKLSVAEMQSSRFAALDPNKIDVNQDGVISTEELQVALPTRERFNMMPGTMGAHMAGRGATGAGSGQ